MNITYNFINIFYDFTKYEYYYFFVNCFIDVSFTTIRIGSVQPFNLIIIIITVIMSLMQVVDYQRMDAYCNWDPKRAIWGVLDTYENNGAIINFELLCLNKNEHKKSFYYTAIITWEVSTISESNEMPKSLIEMHHRLWQFIILPILSRFMNDGNFYFFCLPKRQKRYRLWYILL